LKRKEAKHNRTQTAIFTQKLVILVDCRTQSNPETPKVARYPHTFSISYFLFYHNICILSTKLETICIEVVFALWSLINWKFFAMKSLFSSLFVDEFSVHRKFNFLSSIVDVDSRELFKLFNTCNSLQQKIAFCLWLLMVNVAKLKDFDLKIKTFSFRIWLKKYSFRCKFGNLLITNLSKLNIQNVLFWENIFAFYFPFFMLFYITTNHKGNINY
jgi:hypothetical protein